MHPVMVVMAILGCGDGGDACQQVDRVSTGYATVAQCNESVASELGRFSDLDYPEVRAQCQVAPGSMIADATVTGNHRGR